MDGLTIAHISFALKGKENAAISHFTAIIDAYNSLSYQQKSVTMERIITSLRLQNTDTVSEYIIKGIIKAAKHIEYVYDNKDRDEQIKELNSVGIHPVIFDAWVQKSVDFLPHQEQMEIKKKFWEKKRSSTSITTADFEDISREIETKFMTSSNQLNVEKVLSLQKYQMEALFAKESSLWTIASLPIWLYTRGDKSVKDHSYMNLKDALLQRQIKLNEKKNRERTHVVNLKIEGKPGSYTEVTTSSQKKEMNANEKDEANAL